MIGAGELAWKVLTPGDAGLTSEFMCEKPGCAELVQYIRHGALAEEEGNYSTTFLFVTEDLLRLDAYLTVSAASVPIPPRLKRRLGTERRWIPSVMIDYIAVAQHRDGQGLGRRIFEWVQARSTQLNASIGVRFIVLGVRGENWGAYRIYVRDWGFKALPIRRANETLDPPDPEQPRPAWLGDDDLIHLYYDLVEHDGPYSHWPTLG